MKKHLLTLVRHAKSSWKNTGQSDHDRILNDRGERDSPEMATRLKNRGCIPDLILCSSAVRTQQTAQYLMDAFALHDGLLRVHRSLYLCSPQTILQEVAAVEAGVRHIMIVGHNPGLEQLSSLLSSKCNPQMPTLGVRHFACPGFVRIPLEANAGQAAGSPDHTVDLLFEDFPKNASDRANETGS